MVPTRVEFGEFYTVPDDEATFEAPEDVVGVRILAVLTPVRFFNMCFNDNNAWWYLLV